MVQLWIPLMMLLSAQAPAAPWVPVAEGPHYFAVSMMDVDAAVAWYTRAFGLKVLDDTSADDRAWRIVNLSGPSLSVEIVRDKRHRTAEGRTTGFFKVGFRVPDLDEVADRVEKATGERPRVIQMKRHGLRLLQLRDPEGNLVQLSSPLPEP